MTEPNVHPPQHGKTAAEEDVIPGGKIFLVGLGALVIFFVASVAATLLLNRERARELPDGPAPIPAVAGQHQIGLVEQVQFENQTQVEDAVQAEQKRLGEYGWVDRPHGIIHLPVQRAMELTIQGVRP